MILTGTGPGNRHSLNRNIRGTEASMKPNSSLTEGAFLAELRRRRAELLESVSVVEHALGPGSWPTDALG